MGRARLTPKDLPRQCALFSGLPEVTAQAIMSLGSRCEYRAGEFLARQGEPASHISMIVSGVALISDTNSEGDKLILGWLNAGDVTGLPSLLNNSSDYVLDVQATEPSEVLRWTGPAFRSIIGCYPAITTNALGIAISLSERALHRLRLFASEPVERRLAVLLQQSADDVGRGTLAGTELELSDEQLAQIAGTTLFSVSRILSRWEKSGLLKKSRGRILIPKDVHLNDFLDAVDKLRLPTSRREPVMEKDGTTNL